MGKILKHDFKNSYKEFLIMCAAIIIMSILLGITCLFDLNSFLGRVFFMSLMTFYILIITAVGILWIVYIINSINKKFFTREGYLTFTTPISIDKLIISKILVNFIWFIVVMVTFFISVLIIVFFATRGYVDVFSGLIEMVKFAFQQPLILVTSIIKVILYVLSLLITLFFTLAFLSSVNVRKARTFITLFVYGIVLNIGNFLISMLSFFSVGLGYDTVNFKHVFCYQTGYLTPVIGIMAPIATETTTIMYFSFNQLIGMIGFIVGLYFITRYLITKKLELDSN